MSISKDTIIEKWLPFWESLSTEEKWAFFKIGFADPEAFGYFSFEDNILCDIVSRKNRDFAKNNFSLDEIAFLDALPAEGHYEIALYCFVKSMPDLERDIAWKSYAEELDEIWSSLPELITVVSRDLLTIVSSDLSILFTISDREFEELIAEIFQRQGYKTRLTKKTRDGGYDIYAVYSNLVQQRLLIECKRKREPEAKIPIAVVRQVAGAYTLSDIPADKIVLVTTNRYTPDVKKVVEERHFWGLELKDYDDIVNWIKQSKRP